ncbi:Uncharacterized membrane protein YhaH, DUF805 family [Polaromonas sp. OV174]|nr:DUF805 domain-containing protein [Polaromonas sp. OV174]SFC45852.1 Uncharacterized membrane protein YhaH, DUF805 family [Polaromonas sp. OV174]
MTFFDAVATCLKKFATFSGRASRSEYWWFVLFFTLILTASALVHEWGVLVALAVLLLPLTAAATRRLHDTGRSGWFQLLNLVPLGNLYVLYLQVQQGSPINNRF